MKITEDLVKEKIMVEINEALNYLLQRKIDDSMYDRIQKQLDRGRTI